MKDKSFEKELTALINRYSLENQSDTPDYILSHYLCECLRAWESCVRDRDRWWNRDKDPAVKVVEDAFRWAEESRRDKKEWDDEHREKNTKSIEWTDPEYRERRG